MITVDVLIVGQGICGSFLSRELERVGLSYFVIDEFRPHTASRAAAGLINPVTGRRFVKTWMIDDLLPSLRNAYEEVGEGLLQEARVVDFFPTPQMRLAFMKRCDEGADYLALPSSPAEEQRWKKAFRYELGYGVIGSCFLVDIKLLLGRVRRELEDRALLRGECFMAGELERSDSGVKYRDIAARWLIFCDGVGSTQDGFFERLPFAPNKGEALIIEASELDAALLQAGGSAGGGFVFKRGVSLVPHADGLFWVGSSYEWAFDDLAPTAAFRERTESILREWLRVPFRTIAHFASVRPATVERRPFVGLHPLYAAIGILNGMGTKGCSLAPHFARQLAELLAYGRAVQPDTDVRRFTKILGGKRDDRV